MRLMSGNTYAANPPRAAGRALRAGAAVALAAALLAGCQSYKLVQRNVFSDEDGRLLTVDYGVAEKDHVNTFVSPMTGEELPFKSRLVVEAEMPDGVAFKAWQCMNLRSRGTTYKTDNGRWQVLVNGFTCIVYRQTDDGRDAYVPVYRGVLCDSPAMDVKKDERWKTVRPQQRVYRGEGAR